MFWMQILTSLGPVELHALELAGGSGDGGDDNGKDGGDGEPADTAAIGGKEEVLAEPFFPGTIEIHGDDLSCGRMVLAAARTFASHKIRALVADIQTAARQLR